MKRASEITYPLPEGMYWDDGRSITARGVKHNETARWWHAWVGHSERYDEKYGTFFHLHAQHSTGADSAPELRFNTEDEAYQYISNMLLMGFR
jgi:hypothetical protein